MKPTCDIYIIIYWTCMLVCHTHMRGCERHDTMYGSHGGGKLEGRQLMRGGERGSRGLAGADAERRPLDQVAHARPGCAPRLCLSWSSQRRGACLLVLTAQNMGWEGEGEELNGGFFRWLVTDDSFSGISHVQDLSIVFSENAILSML